MTRIPNSPEMDALTRLSVDPLYRTELPLGVLTECIKAGWVRECDQGFAHVTDAGRKIWQARR